MGSYIFTIIMLVIMACLKFYFPKIKGAIGENRINNLLKTLEPDQYFTLHDLYIPKENGHTTQIDHIVLSPQGTHHTLFLPAISLEMYSLFPKFLSFNFLHIRVTIDNYP